MAKGWGSKKIVGIAEGGRKRRRLEGMGEVGGMEESRRWRRVGGRKVDWRDSGELHGMEIWIWRLEAWWRVRGIEED